MSMIRSLLIASLVVTLPAWAGDNRWTATGPDGGRVRSIAVHPTVAGTVYAGGDGGVFKSTDNGAHWSPARDGIVEPTTAAIVVDPSNPQVIYAGSLLGGGVSRSTDGGATWTARNTGLSITTIASLAIDPANSAALYAGTACCGMYKSTDAGATWKSLAGAGLPDATIVAIVVDPTQPSTLYAATQSQGVYKSTNGGAAWTAATSGISGPGGSTITLYGLAIDPSAPSTLYAAGGGSLFRTTNGGATWAAANGALVDPQALAVAVSPRAPATVLASVLGAGVLRSTDGGASWTPATTAPADTVNTLAFDPRDGTRAFGGAQAGMFVSASGGDRWTSSSTGLSNTVVQALAIDETNPATVYAGTALGLFKTMDGGASWAAINSGLATGSGGLDIRALAVDRLSPGTVYAGTGRGMYKSVLGGAAWQPINNGTTIANITAIVLDPALPNVVRVSTFFTGVFVSTNGGDTWTQENQGLPTPPSIRLMAGGGGGSVLAATTVSTTLGHDSTSSAWQAAGALPAGTDLAGLGAMRYATSTSALADLSSSSGPRAYVAGAGSSPIVIGTFAAILIIVIALFSTSAVNVGLINVWQALAMPTGVDPASCPPVKAIAGSPTAGTFYAGAACGVLEATSNGDKVAAMNTGMPQALQVNALAVTPAGSDIYAGTQGGGVLRYSKSAAPAPVNVVEYYNASLDHYFITWVAAEQANLDAGNTPTRWTRTGYSFKAYTAAQSGTSPVCRFYIPPNLGDSHFFGRGTQECVSTGLKNPTFVQESSDFMQMFLPNAGTCPAATTPVYRVFSNRPDANHRYMTDRAVRDQMVAKGWLAEGDGPDLVVMCAPQ